MNHIHAVDLTNLARLTKAHIVEALTELGHGSDDGAEGASLAMAKALASITALKEELEREETDEAEEQAEVPS